MYKQIPEDEPSGSKHIEDVIKIKILVPWKCTVLVYIIWLYYNAWCKKHEIVRGSQYWVLYTTR
jgi:hypothetical protein